MRDRSVRACLPILAGLFFLMFMATLSAAQVAASFGNLEDRGK